MHQKRLTDRLTSYWDLLRKENTMPEFAKFNNSSLSDVWDYCVLFSVNPGGGDKANTAGAIGGAVLGGIAGNMIGTAAGTKQGMAVTVEFNDGNVKAFIQPADTNIQPGQPVNVEFREDGAYVVPVQYAPAY